MKNTSTLIITLVLSLSLWVVQAEARIYISVDQPSEKKFPVAVANLDGGSGNWSKKLPEVIRKDLTLTALFDVIPPEQYPKGEVNHQAWNLIGAQAVVMGKVGEGGKGGVTVQLTLVDPALGQEILKKTYAASNKDFIKVAHLFADEIMLAMTGEKGVFSTRIAYTQVTGKRKKEIGVMDMDGYNAKVITKDRSISLSPAFSPDGSRIAYTTFTKNGSAEVAVVGSGGGVGKKVTSNGSINVSPAWNPGGSLTVAAAMGGSDTNLYLVGLAGGILRRLTNTFGIDVNPAYAPDGSSMLFASERAGKLHIFKADTSGGSVERLTFVGSQNDNPAWSPKGDKIAFQSLSGGWAIFIMNPDGSNIQRLTSEIGCESPTWAPNGRFIAAGCGGKVHLMREDGNNLTAVGPGGSFQPSWGPDNSPAKDSTATNTLAPTP